MTKLSKTEMETAVREAHLAKQQSWHGDPKDWTPVISVSGKAGEILRSLHKDEPVFVLRAQDILSTMAIQHYATLIEKYSPHSEQAESMVDVIAKFLQWQRGNPGKVKLPD